eukprot:TRINITY_DN39318_c0_g1_i1.p1 TRINITY_DN39318_c0_g1~~TRINITY_DN39318_c0_g1_i1.p1  ORF type:complete len:429 (-),score=95.64 TRINITY_DN39318_c0_g1_i1:95-1318(-)
MDKRRQYLFPPTKSVPLRDLSSTRGSAAAQQEDIDVDLELEEERVDVLDLFSYGYNRLLGRSLVALGLFLPTCNRTTARILFFVLNGLMWLALVRIILLCILDGISPLLVVYFVWLTLVSCSHLWSITSFSGFFSGDGFGSTMWVRKSDVDWISKKSRLILFVCWGILIVNVTSIITLSVMGMYSGEEEEQGGNAKFLNSVPITIVYAILNVFLTAAWIFPLGMFCLFCFVMARQFYVLKNIVQANVVSIVDAREAFEMYDHWCMSSSRMFAMFLRISLITNIALVIFLSYRILFFFRSWFVLVVEIFWAISGVIYLYVMCTSASTVSYHATHISPIIQKSEWQRKALHSPYTHEKEMELQRWLYYLNANSFGITVGKDGIVVTRKLFFQGVSIMCTYFLLLTQFRR